MVYKMIFAIQVFLTVVLPLESFLITRNSRHVCVTFSRQLKVMPSTMSPTHVKSKRNVKMNRKIKEPGIQDNHENSSQPFLPATNPLSIDTDSICNSTTSYDFKVFNNALEYYKNNYNYNNNNITAALEIPVVFRLTAFLSESSVLLDSTADFNNQQPLFTDTALPNNNTNNSRDHVSYINASYHYTNYPLGKIYRKVLNGVLFNTISERTFLNSTFNLSIKPRKYSFETFITALTCYKRKYCSHGEKLVVPRDFIVPLANITISTTTAKSSTVDNHTNIHQQHNTATFITSNEAFDNDNDWPEETRGLKLGLKVQFIRSRHLYNSTAQMGLLRSLGFVWEPQADRAQLLIRTLQTHRSIYGHLDIPKSFTVPVGDGRFEKDAWGLKLGYSIGNIRYRGNYAAHTDTFTQLGLETTKMGADTRHWEHIYSGLKIFKQIYGHLRVPINFIVPSSSSGSTSICHNSTETASDNSNNNNTADVVDAADGKSDNNNADVNRHDDANSNNNSDGQANTPFLWPTELHHLKLGYRAKNIKYRGDFVSENQVYRQLLTDIGFEFQVKKEKKKKKLQQQKLNDDSDTDSHIDRPIAILTGAEINKIIEEVIVENEETIDVIVNKNSSYSSSAVPSICSTSSSAMA